MVKVIMGSRGSGKTKKMIDLVNKALTEEIGNVVCMEKGQNMRLNVKPSAKLIDVTEYPAVNGYDTLMAFINGIYAGNYDVTHVFIDSLYKIAACDDADQAGAFTGKLKRKILKNTLPRKTKREAIFTITTAIQNGAILKIIILLSTAPSDST